MKIDTRAPKVANDIAEDIDCGEDRETLRAVIDWWASKCAGETQKRAAAESKLKIISALVK